MYLFPIFTAFFAHYGALVSPFGMPTCHAIFFVKSIILTIINAFEGKQGDIFNIVFYAIGIFASVLSFVYLFNKRFEDLEAFKSQVKKKKTESKTKKDIVKKDDDLDLPKEKDNK